MPATQQKSTRTIEVRVLVEFWLAGERLPCNSVATLDTELARDLASQGLVDAAAAAVAAARAQGA